jgi:hypothetical protein
MRPPGTVYENLRFLFHQGTENPNLTDNWDDAEGYYRVRIGKLQRDIDRFASYVSHREDFIRFGIVII